MALEMKVYKDPRQHDPKVFAGLTPRQLVATPLMLILGGGTFAAVTLVIMMMNGLENISALFTAEGLTVYAPLFDYASDYGFYAALPVAIPIAAWGWWRPKGLHPETYMKYVLAHQFTRKVTPYAESQPHLHDAAAHRRGDRRAARAIVAREHVAVREAQAAQSRGRRRAAGAQHALQPVRSED